MRRAPSRPAAATIAVSYAGVLGGAERLLLEVACGLTEAPLLACPPGPLADEARARGLGVFELRERSLELRRSRTERFAAAARLAAQAGELRSLLAAVRPGVVIAWNMRAALALGAIHPLAREAPALLFQHNDMLPGPLIGRAVAACAKRADLVVVPSACVARDLEQAGARAQRVRVVHPSVDLERFRPAVSGAGPDVPEVLVLGAIERWKRVDLALEAVALAATELPGLRLRVAGQPIGADGARVLEELRARAAQPDLRERVVFAGAVATPERELARASCLLHCAEREPYGMVLAEALACGLPVVAPRSCGPAEIANEDCGRLYEPGDPADAARALVAVLRDRAGRAAMGAAGRRRAEERFDLERMRAEYARLVGELTGRSRPAAPRSAAHGAELALVTVLHDSRTELSALLDSIERHLPEAQVVAVDSGSSDDGAELARTWRAGAATVVDLGENAGFGRGAGEGLRHVERPVTALVNPDVELLDASLAAAARELRRDPERLLAPLVLRSDDQREDNAQREPGSPALLLHALVPGAALPAPLAAAAEPWRSRGPRRAGWAVASCLLARTETLRRLGPFDESIFMYAEDLDLGLRAADAGVETWFWPAARARHTGAHSSRRAYGGEPIELLAARRRAVVAERRGNRRAWRDDALQLLTFADRLLLKRLTGRPAERERRQLAAQLRVIRARRR